MWEKDIYIHVQMINNILNVDVITIVHHNKNVSCARVIIDSGMLTNIILMVECSRCTLIIVIVSN